MKEKYDPKIYGGSRADIPPLDCPRFEKRSCPCDDVENCVFLKRANVQYRKTLKRLFGDARAEEILGIIK